MRDAWPYSQLDVVLGLPVLEHVEGGEDERSKLQLSLQIEVLDEDVVLSVGNYNIRMQI